jgi:GMP synthase (glutamine-hydrolysing)
VGTYPVTLSPLGDSDPLLHNIPTEFLAHYGHRDIVSTKPEEAVVLATGARCSHAMLRYGTNIYTTQFHPELDRDCLEKLLMTHESYRDAGLHSASVEETPVAEELLLRFIDLC